MLTDRDDSLNIKHFFFYIGKGLLLVLTNRDKKQLSLNWFSIKLFYIDFKESFK